MPRVHEVLLALGSTAICLLVGEVAARRFLPIPARADRSPLTDSGESRKPANRKLFQSLHRSDPLVGWVLNPGSVRFHHRLLDSQGAVQYDVFYSVTGGRRKTAVNPPDGPEVITAGCSFTFGHGLNDEDTWPWLLQQQLARYHVVNTGCMGYGTDQALLVAEREVKEHPGRIAAVVLGFGAFQIERNRSTQGWMSIVYPYSKPLFALRSRNVEYQHQIRFWSGGVAAEYSNLLAALLNAFGNRANGIPSHEGARELTVALITDAAARFQALGIKFAVAILPYMGDNTPDVRADSEFVIRRLRASGISTLVPDFPRNTRGALEVREFMVSRIDQHPNRHYNTVLTGQLQPFLEVAGIASEPGERKLARHNAKR